MRLLLANLLLRYTKCSVHIAGTMILLEWTFALNSFTWALRGQEGTRIILTAKNTLKRVKYYPRVKMRLQTKKQERRDPLN